MRHNPGFALEDVEEIKRVVRENPWVTFVSHTDGSGLVASHYPTLIEEDEGGWSLVTHVGRPDERLHELGRHDMLAIVQGPHGYVSPSWYDEGPAVPTWNFIAVHLTGVPEILADEENLAVLDRLVEHFEKEMPEPRLLRSSAANTAYAERIVSGTVGFRLRPRTIVGKVKMSQNRPAETIERITRELDGNGPYASAPLAREMRLANARGAAGA